MSTNVVADSPPHAGNGHHSVTELVSGIVSDAERLFRQQIEMVRAEFKEDLRRTKEVVIYMSAGVALAALGVAMLLVALVHVIHEFAGLPLSASWAIVGGVALVLGAVGVFVAARILASYNPLPDKSLHALQENVSWIANRQS